MSAALPESRGDERWPVARAARGFVGPWATRVDGNKRIPAVMGIRYCGVLVHSFEIGRTRTIVGLEKELPDEKRYAN